MAEGEGGEAGGKKKKRRGRAGGAGGLGPAGELGAAFQELRVKRPRRAGGQGGRAGPGPPAGEEGPSAAEGEGQSPPGSPVASPARRGPAAHAYREMNRLLGRLHFERRQREGAPPPGDGLPPAG